MASSADRVFTVIDEQRSRRHDPASCPSESYARRKLLPPSVISLDAFGPFAPTFPSSAGHRNCPSPNIGSNVPSVAVSTCSRLHTWSPVRSRRI